ncbi:hypothetical protein CJJ23_02870 [Mycoplasmopsis agassizii]|uniref:Restriction endonuclease subunit M n=2 Tax=Mycoplasmopsis agassizii TaxID=33922 RepID=A0A269TJC8_9BACT|nr:hypothetical protein CJJ23_02870 [Mycoplasmopsis agassizii]
MKKNSLNEILLIDHTTKKNIIWANKNYEKYGWKYNEESEIRPELLIVGSKEIIQPRVYKNKEIKNNRTKQMAEVFTPSWICNKQNNLIDNEFFGYKNSFNHETENGWTKTKKVDFKNKNWKEYIDLERLEITCGEAPYLTSRYDSVTGEIIKPLDRIGLLDRKLRVIFENVDTDKDFLKYSFLALKRTYGFDFQGDNVLLARNNLLQTFVEFYIEKFSKKPTLASLKKAAKIISWNIFQMDGLKYVVPFSCNRNKIIQDSLFGDPVEEIIFCLGCMRNDSHKHKGQYAKIKDWRLNKIIRFIDLLDKE